MSDESAVKLFNLLAEYARASVEEGATLSEVGGWTIRDTLSDIQDTTPPYLTDQLDATGQAMLA